jgi:hypothetical protein
MHRRRRRGILRDVAGTVFLGFAPEHTTWLGGLATGGTNATVNETCRTHANLAIFTPSGPPKKGVGSTCELV